MRHHDEQFGAPGKNPMSGSPVTPISWPGASMQESWPNPRRMTCAKKRRATPPPLQKPLNERSFCGKRSTGSFQPSQMDARPRKPMSLR